ncbi:MAG: RNA polymerase sigma factor [Devosiaceae bacterium]|nr:RNA polymerase sigma factor [Devosiaceae bacterium]
MSQFPNKQQDLAHHTAKAVDNLVREEWGKLLALLISQLKDFQLAEDALQDAIESALIHWQRNGLPRSPPAWLLQTARRKAIDRIRRTASFNSKSDQIASQISMSHELSELIKLDATEVALDKAPAIRDERLRLIFTCCHPAIEAKSRTALTLRTLGGLSTAEIARAFLDAENTMAQRLVRAKKKIKQAGIPYSVPEGNQIPERLQAVLEVLYLIFNAGYFSTHGSAQLRVNLSDEAIRLSKILLKLMPDIPEIEGLLALMLLHDSRRLARFDSAGDMISLKDQDRNIWDSNKIASGLKVLHTAFERKKPGPYQIQAAISAIHAQAKSHKSTDWKEIVGLYDELYRFLPNPVIALNRIVANSYYQGPDIALDQMKALEEKLQNYQPFFAAKADLLHRSGKIDAAEVTYIRAIDLSDEDTTRLFLQKKLGRMLRQN